MKLVSFTLISFLLIILIFILVYAVWGRSSQEEIDPDVIAASIQKALTVTRPPQIWSTPEDIPGDARAKCLVYNFTPLSITPEGNLLYDFEASPSLNTQTLNGITGEPIRDNCVNVNSIVAKRQIRTCLAPSGGICLNDQGEKYVNGEQEVIYVSCREDLQSCKGFFGQLVFQFNRCQPQNNLCLSILRSPSKEAQIGDLLEGSECDPTDDRQIFTIIRTDANGRENSSGQFASIRDNTNTYCIAPDFTQELAPGSYPLRVVSCFAEGNEQAKWYLLPALAGESGPDGRNIIPQQIVWRDQLEKAPTSVNQILKFIREENPISIRITPSLEDPTLLQAFVAPVETDLLLAGQAANSTILDYRIATTLWDSLTYPSPDDFPGCCEDPTSDNCRIPNYIPYYSL